MYRQNPNVEGGVTDRSWAQEGLDARNAACSFIAPHVV